MRIFVVALFVGLAVGSPIGQVEVTTTLPQDLLRSDIDLTSNDATTIVVEILADDATIASVTDRARQAPAAGEDESNEDGDEEEGTTASPGGGGSGSSVSSQSSSRNKPQPAIPQPLANSSNFLAEYQFSTQFNLGPKDEKLPLAVAPGQANPVEPISPQLGQLAQTLPEGSQVAAVVPPNLPPAVPAAAQQLSGAAVAPPANASSPSIVAGGEDEDDAESDEENLTEAPSARLQQQQQVEAQRIEESDSDNEITSDDVTTVKSFASEYEYTVQQLGASKRVPS